MLKETNTPTLPRIEPGSPDPESDALTIRPVRPPIEIMNDYGLEQLVHFPTRERNTLGLIITSLPGQFVDIHSPDRLSDHDIVSGTLKVVIPPIKKPKRKVYRYLKGDYESMRKDTLKFAKERYFNGYSDTRSVQENLTSELSFCSIS